MVKQKNKSNKPKVAVQSITGCAGCQLEIYYIEDVLLELLDAVELVAAPMIKEKNYDGPVDICFVEGSVSHTDSINKVKKWRENSKILVALGACAGEGGVQQQKNFMDKKKVQAYVYGNKTKHLDVETPVPITEYVEVDYYIKGCPADKEEIVWFVKQALLGKVPKQYEKPVCHECKLREKYCLLEQGQDCYGPITFGNCSVMCPDYNHPCTGCRGPFSDGNFEEHIKLLQEKGFSKRLIMQRINKYGGLRTQKIMQEAKDGKNHP
ncbi:hypothetical protein GOV08_01880 [Candidatus Woesearchaeota archaeon]|nr:hypothetical protein [Candidatus Woesearchaeota archaeon]